MSLGYIRGFESQHISAFPYFNITVKDCWGSKIDVYEETEKGIKITFHSNGEYFQVLLRRQNGKGDMKGDIIVDNEVVGTCYYRLFQGGGQTLFWGEWAENTGKWHSVIEVFFSN